MGWDDFSRPDARQLTRADRLGARGSPPACSRAERPESDSSPESRTAGTCSWPNDKRRLGAVPDPTRCTRRPSIDSVHRRSSRFTGVRSQRRAHVRCSSSCTRRASAAGTVRSVTAPGNNRAGRSSHSCSAPTGRASSSKPAGASGGSGSAIGSALAHPRKMRESMTNSHVRFGRALGTRLVLSSATTGGAFGLVEHDLPAGQLGAPVHTHEREDEYSYVLAGRLWAQVGDEVVEAGPGEVDHEAPRHPPHVLEHRQRTCPFSGAHFSGRFRGLLLRDGQAVEHARFRGYGRDPVALPARRQAGFRRGAPRALPTRSDVLRRVRVQA